MNAGLRLLGRGIGVRMVLMACGFALASVAHGQLKPEVQTGSLIPVNPKALDPTEAGYVRKHFAECVYHGVTAKANALLRHSDAVTVDLAAAGIKRVGEELDMSSCLGRQASFNQLALGLKFPPSALRDLMAEEAYLAHYRSPPLASVDMPPLNPAFVSTDKALTAAQAVTDFTDCTVRGDLVHADALLRTMPGSNGEHIAAAALAPTLGKCLVQGQQVKLTAASIRALVSFGLWSRFVRDKTP